MINKSTERDPLREPLRKPLSEPLSEPLSGRLISFAGSSDEPVGAGQNMAIDQAILESVDQTSIPVLRWYRWQRPTLSLGYFQKYGDRKRHRESLDAACVRRASGGGAILHHHELTYSIVIPNGHGKGNTVGANTSLYVQLHEAFSQSLKQFGIQAMPFKDWSNRQPRTATTVQPDPFLCFARRTDQDLITAGYKILGSAQRRGKRSIMQHGSLLIRASPYAPQLPGLIDLGATINGTSELLTPLTEQIASATRVCWKSSALNEGELERADEIASQKFNSQNWTCRR